jgi:hypothetical protein
MNWFIEDNVFDDTLNNDASNVQRIFYAAQELGCDVRYVKYRPFHATDWSILDISGCNEPVIFYGSLNACKEVQSFKVVPGAWNDWNKLQCSSYYSKYGKHVVNNRYAMYPFGDLLRLKDSLFDLFGGKLNQPATIRTVGGGDVIFIRPDENNKVFTGACVSKYNFDSWHNTTNNYDVSPETICVVSTPVHIKSETRCIIAEGKVIAHSLYALNGQTYISPESVDGVVDFAEMIAKIWQPHPIFIMDIAQTDNGFAVMELGSVNCAGFYKCDVVPIVEAMTRIAKKEYNEVLSHDGDRLSK